jgi:hypothetical protein
MARPPKYDYKPTGRLQLQISNVPAYMGPIRRTWADGKYQKIENCVSEFIVGLSAAAAAIKKNRLETEERHRQREESANEKKKNGALQRSANGKSNLSQNLLETGKRLRAFGNSLEPSRNKRHSRIFRRKRKMISTACRVDQEVR